MGQLLLEVGALSGCFQVLCLSLKELKIRAMQICKGIGIFRNEGLVWVREDISLRLIAGHKSEHTQGS